MFKYEILRDTRSVKKFSTKEARLWLRNKKAIRNVDGIAKKIVEACDELVAAGILVNIDGAGEEDPRGADDRNGKGRATRSYKKRAWTEIAGDEEAAKVCKRFGVSDVNFE